MNIDAKVGNLGRLNIVIIETNYVAPRHGDTQL